MTDPSRQPALLGGNPLRPEGPPRWPICSPAVAEAFRQLAHTGDWGKYQGRHCSELEQCLRERLNVPHVQLTSSGTAAIELALRGVGIGPGDEVLLAAYDFKANFTNIALLGATPVLVDIHSGSGQLDLAELAQACSPATKAILASHLHGGMVDMPALREFASTRGLPIIEDACQMPGASLAGRPAGTWGDVGVFSFGGSKTLSAGRGGVVFTPQAEVAQRIKLYTERGNSAYPLSEMQAAVLVPQLQELRERHQARTHFVQQLLHRLPVQSGLTIWAAEAVGSTDRAVPSQPDYYKLGCWYDTALLAGLPRELFCQAMRAEGIPLDPGFRGLHCLHARKRFRAVGELPWASRADQACVVLHHPFLLTGDVGVEQFLQALESIRYHALEILRAAESCGAFDARNAPAKHQENYPS